MSGLSPGAQAKLADLMQGMQGGQPDMTKVMAAMQDPELGPVIQNLMGSMGGGGMAGMASMFGGMGGGGMGGGMGGAAADAGSDSDEMPDLDDAMD